MRQFAINLQDKRVVLCTKETLSNIDYFPISQEIAFAIRDKVVSAETVVSKIKGKLMSSPEQWDELLKNKKSQNMHKSDISIDTTETLQTVITPNDVKGEFKMDDVVTKKAEVKVEEETDEKLEETAEESSEVPRRGRPKKAE